MEHLESLDLPCPFTIDHRSRGTSVTLRRIEEGGKLPQSRVPVGQWSISSLRQGYWPTVIAPSELFSQRNYKRTLSLFTLPNPRTESFNNSIEGHLFVWAEGERSVARVARFAGVRTFSWRYSSFILSYCVTYSFIIPCELIKIY